MKISALITTYNRREYVKRAIESVLSQTLPVDEVIVVDDGSTDGTAEALTERFLSRVRVVRQMNQGVSSARRLAVKEARGEWIAFLDSDDEWTPDRNCLLTEAASAIPSDVAWIFGDICLIRDNDDRETIFEKYGLRLDRSPQVFEDSMVVQYPYQYGLLQSSLIRKKALVEVDAFGAGLKHSEDFLAGVQIACRYRFAAIRQIVTRMRRTSDLRSSSLDFAGQNGGDYYRARMMAFSLIARSGRKGRWGEFYSEAVRGLCKLLVDEKKDIRAVSFEQFRYGITGKSIAFECAALLGRPGLKLWDRLGRVSRRIRGNGESLRAGLECNS